MNTLQKIEVMQAYLDGKPIEFKNNAHTEWAPIAPLTPGWDWVNYNYRAAPIKRKYRVAIHKYELNLPYAVPESAFATEQQNSWFGGWISDVMEYELTDTPKTAG